eukprot:gene9500-biopygen15254
MHQPPPKNTSSRQPDTLRGPPVETANTVFCTQLWVPSMGPISSGRPYLCRCNAFANMATSNRCNSLLEADLPHGTFLGTRPALPPRAPCPLVGIDGSCSRHPEFSGGPPRAGARGQKEA